VTHYAVILPTLKKSLKSQLQLTCQLQLPDLPRNQLQIAQEKRLLFVEPFRPPTGGWWPPVAWPSDAERKYRARW
jgi:hypothetical protein